MEHSILNILWVSTVGAENALLFSSKHSFVIHLDLNTVILAVQSLCALSKGSSRLLLSVVGVQSQPAIRQHELNHETDWSASSKFTTESAHTILTNSAFQKISGNIGADWDINYLAFQLSPRDKFYTIQIPVTRAIWLCLKNFKIQSGSTILRAKTFDILGGTQCSNVAT